MEQGMEIPVLKMLVVIVDRERLKAVETVFREEHVHMHFVCLAQGTANSEILDILGLGSTDKVIAFCPVSAIRTKPVMTELSQRLNLQKPGRGIAFTMPLSAVSSPIQRVIEKDLKESWEKAMDHAAEKSKRESNYDLILAVANQGCSEDVMDAARGAGATGGTVIHARRIGLEDTVKFFGISITAEKEVVAILAKSENKHAIMQAICQQCGLKTEAKAKVLSLPVDSIAGLS